MEKALPAASRFLSRFIYTTSYTFSYGVVFPAVLIAKSIPSDNAVVHGLVDGARAASDTVDQWKSSRVGNAADRFSCVAAFLIRIGIASRPVDAHAKVIEQFRTAISRNAYDMGYLRSMRMLIAPSS